MFKCTKVNSERNMKRVAVITFFQSQDNYGQLLQCFALQKILQKLGTSPCVIRYGFHRHYYHCLPWKDMFSKTGFYILQKNLNSLYYEKIKAKYPNRGFNRFRHNHIHFTHRCYNSLEDLQRNPPKADIYITGSDQVWAQLISSDNNRSFFLDFGGKTVKRIAYAPSFALDNYPKDLWDDLRQLLKKLNAVSVREKTGVSICEKVGIHAQLVLDPTLLLTHDDYNFLSSTVINHKYCFAYHVNISTSEELQWASVSKYNERYGIKTYATFANPHDNIDMRILVGAEYVYPTIPQWLGWIKNAEFVLTSSFHGIIFSILFHVPFVVCLREESMYAGNDRVITLLNSLYLDDRILSSGTCIENILSKKINWIDVDTRLSALRLDSLAFLSKNIS